MTSPQRQQPPAVDEPMRTALRGAGRYMGELSAGLSGKRSMRYDYRTWLEANRGTAYAVMRYWAEEKSDGERTVRPAKRELFARVPDDAVMLMVVCSPERPEGQVTELQPEDQLYSLSVPAGRMVALELEKCRRRQA